jgi:hypothetical protein
VTLEKPMMLIPVARIMPLMLFDMDVSISARLLHSKAQV